MAEGLGRHSWAHTSVLCALLANIHRDPRKQRPFKPDDFNPYAGPRARGRKSRGHVIEVTPQTIGLLRQAFTGFAPRTTSNRKDST